MLRRLRGRRESILAQGLERFYEFRTTANPAAAHGQRNWSIYDRDSGVRAAARARRRRRARSVLLQIDGLHCAACAWLIESASHASMASARST